MNDDLLDEVKSTLNDENPIDDDILRGFLKTAISYSEKYQRLYLGAYTHNPMGGRTRKAIVKLTQHYYVTRLGNTVKAENEADILRDVNTLLWEDRNQRT